MRHSELIWLSTASGIPSASDIQATSAATCGWQVLDLRRTITPFFCLVGLGRKGGEVGEPRELLRDGGSVDLWSGEEWTMTVNDEVGDEVLTLRFSGSSRAIPR